MLSISKKVFVLGLTLIMTGSFAGHVGIARSQQVAQTPEQERASLEQELQQLEKEINQYEGNIAQTKQQKQTLQNQISILRNKIAKVDLQIKQSNALIDDLRIQIGDTATSIEKTASDIDRTGSQLADLLQTIYEEDQKTILEVLLTGKPLSDFFDNLTSLELVNQRSRELLADIQSLNEYLRGQKDTLETDKATQENYVRIQILQKQDSQSSQREQEKLLLTTSGQEKLYQELLADRQKRAQEIRLRIFDLSGVSDAPTFGEAVEIAKAVSLTTGVRPALLLAVLTQESNLGKNVGQCYLKDPKTGAGVNAKSGKTVKNIMKPTRDVSPFLTITKELGKDPYNTAVSCPIPSVGGYGGAMGPAQFIPSTWMGYRDRLKEITGRAADPWNIRDAFLAAAVYLGDYGAKNQIYNSEWRSAMIYFSGSTNTAYRFYGDSVMSLATQYQKDIEAIQ